MRSGGRRLLVTTIVLAAVLAVLTWLVVPQMGPALVVSETVVPVDAIVVLGGNAPERLRHGEDLWQAGVAPMVIVSNERLATHGFASSWLALYQAGRVPTSLPPSAVVVLDDPPPTSTRDEAQRTARLLAERGAKSAVVVTDPFHSRRAAWVFAAEYRRYGLTTSSSPAPRDELDLPTWWQRPRSVRAVLEEYTKLVAYLFQGAYW